MGSVVILCRSAEATATTTTQRSQTRPDHDTGLQGIYFHGLMFEALLQDFHVTS